MLFDEWKQILPTRKGNWDIFENHVSLRIQPSQREVVCSIKARDDDKVGVHPPLPRHLLRPPLRVQGCVDPLACPPATQGVLTFETVSVQHHDLPTQGALQGL